MGKQKGERTKNRPSSSSLAASLLPSGAVSVGFGGYLGSSKLEQPSSSEESSPFVEVDNEVAQHIKRLGRKDPITKIKALTSLCSLFKQRPGDEIVQIIPQWAFEYKRLLLDYNREVRRATHEAMTSLVSNVRKGLVPHMKSLMGPWWFSQFDPILEVSQAAKKSMEAAFPAPERRLDALMLYVNDIFIYLDENMKLTPQSMSDKATPMDELEDMHQRVISSSLLAVATLIDVLLGSKNLESKSISSEQKLASKARIATISCAEKLFVLHNYFLDFFKSKNSIIRSATYSVLTSFIKQLPQAFNDENIKSISGMILGDFQEKEASCHSTLWDMILIFIRKFPNCWSHINFQKIVFNRFWNFLRHGCYGSQQISYPALILFLESIPPNVTGGEQFVLDFFESLWTGRNPSFSSSESLAFFKAFKECFLWVLSNVSRYNSGRDAINPLSIKLVDNILVTLAWHDYLFSVNIKNNDESLEERLRKPMEKYGYCYTSGYVEELGKCIVGILADLSDKELDLLSAFSRSFQKDSLEIFQKEEFKLNFQEHVERLSKFCHLLNESACHSGQKWAFHYFAGPLFVKCFKVIITMDSPYAVKFLCILFEIFGPVTLLPCLYFCNEDQLSTNLDDISNKTKEMYFMQAFRDNFVPWCLARHSPSCAEKLELLIYSIQGDFFSDQWNFILTCAIEPHNYASIDTEMLNVLIEKVKERIRKMKKEEDCTIGYLPEHWQHQLLDAAATLVAIHTYSTTHSAQFLCSVLGGAREYDKTCFLSQAAVFKIFEEIFRRLVSFFSISPLKWVKLSSSLLLSSTVVGSTQNEKLPTSDVLRMAQFAFEVLEGSINCIYMLGDNSTLLPCTLAAIFIIDLEYRMSSITTEENVNLEEESEEKLALGRRMQALFCNENILLLKNLSSSNLSTLRNVLVHALRFAIFETSNLSSDKISSLSCEWVLHLLEVTCHDQAELQVFLDQLLSENDSWSFWVLPPKSVESKSIIILEEKEHEAIEVLRHNQFIAFIDKLITKLGFPEVIARVFPPTGHAKDVSSYSRAWLAAELLCTWEWQGGNTLDSFLPSLSKHAAYDSSHPNGHAIFTIFDILLDGVFINGVKSMWIYLDTCIAAENEIKNIKEPFLRALVSLLFTLFVKFKVWTKLEAIEIFKKVVDRLFIDGNVDKTCLRIFPYVMSALIEPLLLQSSEFDESSKDVVVLAHWKDDMVIENVLKWLERALLFPPIGLGYDEESDVGEWIQLIISCYPLRTTNMPGASKVDVVRDISHPENSLLLSLFQNQRSGYNASLGPLSAQMILSKLTVVSVGYCWKYFSEDDWHFVLDNMQKWIELSVLMIEEMVEKIDEIAITNTSNSNDQHFINKLELAVKTLDPSKINISSTALLILSLCSQLFDLQEAGDVEVLQSIKHEKWSEIKDRVLENVLRLFFATGASEAIASSFGSKASLVVASNRAAYSQFWTRVSSFVISAPYSVKSRSMQSMELWGLSKGPTNSVYTILFSSKPIVSLQNTAYRLISSEPLCRSSLLKENYLVEDVNVTEDTSQNKFETSSSDSISIVDEISHLIQKPASELLELDLVSLDRVNVYLAWAILLSYLHSLPPSSAAREALIQFIQESLGSSILDCIFQNIPLKQISINSKKKDNSLCPEAQIAADAAKNIIDSGTTVLDLETLFPIGNEQMASFAGSIYGMMIWLLPSYVRNWFTSIRDRGLLFSIESFTKVWCSPSLVSTELSQVKESVVADENFSVSVNKSAYELVATYKKEETGMDLVISLPNCYPLRPVEVDCTRSLGISEVKKRKWLLSLTAFVRNQNGAIGEAIGTWKNNLDKEFLGVEECPICYSIIHTANHSLPRLACKTCKHKFHSVCLYKWFSTSHKSTCPLCQMPF